MERIQLFTPIKHYGPSTVQNTFSSNHGVHHIREKVDYKSAVDFLMLDTFDSGAEINTFGYHILLLLILSCKAVKTDKTGVLT